MLEILFGFIAGNITGLGRGGGTILILLLSLFTNLDQHIVQGTNIIFFLPASIASIMTNLKHKNVDIKLARTVSFYGVLGAVLGAIISKKISSNNLKKFFAIFILIIAINEIHYFYKEYKRNKIKHNN